MFRTNCCSLSEDRLSNCAVCVNSYSQFQEEYSLEQILKSPAIHGYLTKLQCWLVFEFVLSTAATFFT